MARVKSIVQLSGKVGDTVFIRRNNETIAGMKGGPTASQIATAPEFVNTRKNMLEFGACAKYAKYIFVALALAIFNTCVKKTSMKNLTAALRQKQQAFADPAELFGQRTVMLYSTLAGFQFNLLSSLSSVFSVAYTKVWSVGGNSVTVTFPAINPAVDMVVPLGATHFKLFTQIACLGDSIYNATTGQYDPPTKILTADAVSSAYISTTTGTAIDTELINLLTGSPVMVNGDKVLLVVGISFYKEIGGSYNKMFGSDALLLDEVYTHTV